MCQIKSLNELPEKAMNCILEQYMHSMDDIDKDLSFAYVDGDNIISYALLRIKDLDAESIVKQKNLINLIGCEIVRITSTDDVIRLSTIKEAIDRIHVATNQDGILFNYYYVFTTQNTKDADEIDFDGEQLSYLISPYQKIYLILNIFREP